MDINLEFDSSVQNAPAGFTTAVQYAASYFDTLLTDPITVNISVGFDEIGAAPIAASGEGEGGPLGGTDITYGALQQALAAHLTSAAQEEMLTNLPATDPTGGGANVYISPAEEKAWGMLPANATALDGEIGFNTTSFENFDPNQRNDPSTVDFIGVAEHEIAHALGRTSENAQFPAYYSLLDLTRYAAPGVLASPSTASPYFSVDGGNTVLNYYDTKTDPADWAASAGPDAFDAMSQFGTEDPVTPVDVTLMNVLGFAVAGTSPPTPSPKAPPGPGTDSPDPPCFVAGTRILTSAGEVPVEEIGRGEMLPTLPGGRVARVRWLGGRRSMVPPVRIAAGAFGAGAPHRALLLSPDHAVQVDGALIPVRHLLNGASIAAAPGDGVTYWHLELDRHAVVLAEGLACESYLDTGNRQSLAEAGVRAPAAFACADSP